MADDFRIQISAEVKSTDLENIKNQINSLKTTPVKLNIDTKDIQNQIGNIKKQIENLGNIRINLNGNINGIGGAGTDSIKKSVNDVNQAYNDLVKLQNRINSVRIKIHGLDSGKSTGQIDELRGQLNRLMTDYNNLYQTFGRHFSTDQIDNLNRAFEVTNNKITALSASMRDGSAIKQQTEAYKQLYTVAKQMDNLELQIGKLSTAGGNDTQISVLKSQLESLRKEYQSLYSALQGNLSTSQLSALGNSFYDLQNKLDVLNAKVTDTQTKLVKGIQLKIDNGIFENQISSIEGKFKSLNTENQRVSVSIQKLKDLLKNMNGNSDIKSVIKDYESFQQTLTSVTNQVSEMQKVSKQTATSQQTLINSQTLSNNIQTWMNNNTKAAQQFGVQLKDLQNKLSNNTNPAVLKNCSAEFKKIQSEAKAAGITVNSFASSLKSAVLSAVGLSSLTTAFYTGIRNIKQGISTIVELDNALIDLQKTATATKIEFDDFYFGANDVAKKYGASTQEIIQSAADWSRSGYNLNDSKLMAQYSSMFKSISPEMNIDTATTSLVSIMKAYGIEAENVLDDVMSKINKVGNTSATSNLQIVNGLQRSSAAMAAMDSTLEENIALFTAAQEIIQDDASVGNALKTVSMRVRGYDEETQQLSEDLANISGEVVDLTKTASNANGISLFTDETQTEYKSIYEYLQEVSKIYDELGAKQKQELMEKLFGKQRASVGSAILSNFEAAEKAMTTMSNSAGSAEKEMETIAQSLVFKLNNLKETGTGIIQDIFRKEEIGSTVDGLTSVLELIGNIVDKVGVLPTLMTGISAALSFKNIGILQGIGSISKFKNQTAMTFDTGFAASLSNDETALRNYQAAVASGVNQTKAFEEHMAGASDAAMSYAQNVGVSGMAVSDFVIQQKASQVSVIAQNKSLSTAKSLILEYNSNCKNTGLTQAQFTNAVGRSNAGLAKYLSDLNGAKGSWFGYITSLIGAKAATIALQAATMALNMALTMGISTAVSFIISAVGKLIVTSSELDEKVSGITQKFNEQKTTLQENKSTLNEVSERYGELSKGVNSLGENVSLTSGEYEEYQGIVSTIADMFPTLVEGYNSQGTAILSCKGNVEELTNAYNELVVAQNSAVISNGKDIWKDFKNKQKDLDSSNWNHTEMTTRSYEALKAGLTSNNIDEWALKYISKDNISDGYNQWNRTEIAKALENAGLERGTFESNYKFIIRNLKSNPSIVKSIITDFEAQFDSVIEGAKSYAEATLSTALKDSNLNFGIQSLLESSFNSLGYDFYSQFDTPEQLSNYINNVVNELDNLGNYNGKKLTAFLDVQTQYNNGECSKEEYLSALNDAQSIFEGLSNDTQKQFEVFFNFDVPEEETTKSLETIEDKVQAVKDSFSSKLGENKSINSISDANIKNEINDFNKWLDSLSDEDKELIYQIGVKADDTSLWTLTKWQSELVRVKTGAAESEEALQKFYNTLNNTSEGSFNDSLNSYKEQVDSFKDYLNKIDVGTITDNEKLNLALAYPELAPYINDTDSLRNAIQNLINTTNGGIDTLIEEQIRDLNIEGTSAAEALRTLGEVVKSNNFKFDIDNETQKFNNLYSAIKESVSATGMTSDSMAKVSAMFSELEGYDPSKLFERTENGIHMNTTALRKLTSEYENQKKADIDSQIKSLQEEYKQLSQDIENADNITKQIELFNQRDKIVDELNSVVNLATQYEGLTSTYNKWIQAQSSGNERDMYENILSGKSTVEDLISRGWEGSDVVRNYVDLLSSADLSTATVDEVMIAWDNLGKTIGNSGYSVWDFFTTDGNGKSTSEGVYRFFDTVKSELGEAYAWIDEETGKFNFDFGLGKDAEIAEKFGMDVEALQAILRAASDGNFEIHLDNAYSSLSELNNKATNALETLKTLKRDGKIDFKVSDINLDFSTVEEAEVEVKKAQKVLDRFRDENGKVDLSIEGAEESEILLFNLIKQKQRLSQPEIMSVDTTAISAVDSELGNAIELLQQFYELSNQLEAEIKMGVVDTTDTQQQIQDVASKLSAIPDDTKVKLGLDDADFTTALQNIHAAEINVNAGINPDDILTIQGSIDSIEAKDIEMMTNSSEIMSEMQKVDRYNIKDKDFSVIANTMSAMTQLQIIKNQIDNLTDKTVTIRTNNITVNSAVNADYNMKKPALVQGTAHAVGTAFAKGDWGTKKSEIALTGELGQELISYGGKFWTVGDNGAEFSYIPQGAIVFNAEQTREIFAKGKINSRGKSFANGTAFSSGTGGTYKPNFNSGGGSSSGNAGNSSSPSSSGKPNNKPASSNSSASDAAEEFKEIIDWIEIAIDRIERAISTLDLKAQSIYRSWSDRNDNLKNEITKVSEEITLQQKAYNRYLQEADSIGLSEEWAEKVRNGKIDIETITDEDLNDKISQYREWYEKAIDCRDAMEELTETVSELYETAFENVSSRFEGIINAIEHKTSMIEEFINRTEEKGYIVSIKYYETLIGNEKTNIQELEKEKSELISAMQTAVDSGAVTENSESWYEMVSEINDVTLAIEEANTETIKFGNAIREIQWNIFDLIEERISFITQEADFLIRLMENERLYDDRGQLTEQGISTMGLHGANYNVYMAQADKYSQEMLNIDKELANDPYNQDLFERRQELFELQQEMILAANEEKEAIRDMVQEGIELELDSLRKLIDEYENALDAEKDLYDYQKKISSQTEAIASLEKQLSAYANDTSEETKAKVQKLKVSLQEAKEDLQETQYDKYISDQKKLLDELYNEYETILNQRLDDLDMLVRDMIQDINDNSSLINNTLISEAESVGYKLSDNMIDIWNNSNDTNHILAVYGDKFLDNMTSVSETLNSIGINIQNMIGQLNKLADTDIDAISNSYQNINENINSVPDTIEKPVVSEIPDDKNSDITKSDSDIKTGEKINAGNAKIYSYIGAGGVEQYYKSDPVYIVLSEKDGYVQVRHHKLSSGISGWFKKSDINAYKNGTYNLKQNELAWTQEDGVLEAIIRRSDGAILTPLNSGDSVLNGNATANLFDFTNSPADFIYKNLFDSKNFGNSSKISNSSNNTSVNFENVNFNLPNVKNYNEFLYALQHDKRFESMVRAMTTDRIFGGSSLKKYHL